MDHLKLIGVRDANYLQWRQNLLLAIIESGRKYELEEVNNVDDIIQYQVSAIPALLINNELGIEQNGHIPETNDFINFLNQKNQNMQNIIVPTDFSPASENAFKYAQALAAATYSDLKVVHVFHPVGNDNTIIIPSLEELQKSREQQMEAFVDTIKAPGQKKIATAVAKTEVVQGFAVEVLEKMSKEEDTDFILMGTTGEGGLAARLLGSISTDVSQKAHCPVWLIPPKAKFKGIKKILYAGNYESANSNVVEEIVNLSQIFDSSVHLVHVNNTTAKKKDWEFEDLVLKELFQQKIPSFQFEMHTVQSDKVWKGLYDYADEEDIDLIVLVTRRRSFWDKLLHKSMTKDMILNAEITPLLVMHVND